MKKKRLKIALLASLICLLARIIYVNVTKEGIKPELYSMEETLVAQGHPLKICSISLLEGKEKEDFREKFPVILNPDQDYILKVEIEGDLRDTKEKAMGLTMIINRQARTWPVFGSPQFEEWGFRLFFAFRDENFKHGENELIIAVNDTLIEDNVHKAFQRTWDYQGPAD